MSHWYMLTVIGKDRRGIVAALTHALFEAGCHLGEATMMRLGGNFTIMLMVETESRKKALQDMVEPVAESMDLSWHLDQIEGHLHQHHLPDVCITVSGADRPGIVSQVTGALAEAGLEITDLESDVAGSEEQPVYIMQIEGVATEGIEALRSALNVATVSTIDVTVTPVDTLIG